MGTLFVRSFIWFFDSRESVFDKKKKLTNVIRKKTMIDEWGFFIKRMDFKIDKNSNDKYDKNMIKKLKTKKWKKRLSWVKG